MKSSGKSARNSSDRDEPLQVTVPKATKRSLKMVAAERGEPMRLIVLRALEQAGIHVPAEELHDRRKAK